MFRLLCTGGLLLVALPTSAGNRWMMEQNARELIEMADAVASQVQGVKPEEQLRFEARVVERGGQRVIHLERVSVTAAPQVQPPQAHAVQVPATQPQSVPASTAEYHPAIRYAPLLSAPDASAPRPAGLVGGGAALAEVNDFPGLLAQHPEAKAYELQGSGTGSGRSFWVSW